MAAKVPGTSRPSTPRCSSSRFTETPDRAGGDALGDELAPCARCRRRSPVRWRRRAHPSRTRARAPCGICAATSIARGMRSSASRYSPTRLPVPPDGLAQRRAGDALDALHETDEPVVAVGRGGCEPDAAVAHDHGGDAVPDRRREQRVPGDLAVVVRVHVDEAGVTARPVASISSRPSVVDDADRGDEPVVDGHVGDDRRVRPGRRSRCRCE